MSKISLIAAALFAVAGAGATLAAPAFAEDMRAQASCGVSGYDCNRHQEYRAYNDGGLGRYCPPGQYPHSFPGGSGIRCETVDGAW